MPRHLRERRYYLIMLIIRIHSVDRDGQSLQSADESHEFAFLWTQKPMRGEEESVREREAGRESSGKQLTSSVRESALHVRSRSSRLRRMPHRRMKSGMMFRSTMGSK